MKLLSKLSDIEIVAMLAGLICLLLSGGCGVLNPNVKDLTAATKATYKTVKVDESTEVSYESNKNQENFKAAFSIDPDTNKITGLSVETTATTPEAAMAAVARAQERMTALIEKLMSMIPVKALGGL